MTSIAQMVAPLLPRRDASETEAAYASRVQSACDTVEALGGEDPVDRMFAVQALGAHYAAMRCYRLAIRPGTEFATANRWGWSAIRMGRTMRDTMQILKQRRRGRLSADPG